MTNRQVNTKKILLTGPSGYIGRHVLGVLLDLGHEVTAVCKPHHTLDPRAKRLEMDIFHDFSKLQGKDYTGCVHLAWNDGFKHNSEYHLTHLNSHFQFLKHLVETGIPQLSIAGSMHEVGYFVGEIQNDTKTEPQSFYAVAKNALRQSMQIYLADKTCAFQWLRFFYVLGDDERNSSIFSKIIQWEKEGKESFPFTRGLNKYDFIHIEELAKQIAIATTQTDVLGIIHCCTGQPKSLSEQIEVFLKSKNFKIRPEYGKFKERPYDSPEIWGSAKQIQAILKKHETKK